MTERERFIRAFNKLINREVKPTAPMLNKEIGRQGREIPGRLSKLRRKLLQKAGYMQTPVFTGHWKRLK